MKISLASISFNHAHLPDRAIIRTGRSRVKIVWRDVCGDWCWFMVSGYPDAGKAAILALIREVERMAADLALR